jgi:hypothetical protein
MVSRLFSAAGSVLTQVSEVLAPQVHSPLEDLRHHWRAIRKFYIDHEKDDDIESFHASQLPEHLISIVTILLEEEVSLGDTGPCFEFFLQNKILETLCALGERDTPPGVRKLVLQTVTILLSDSTLPLLPHMSVHRPIRNLIRRLIMSPINQTPPKARLQMQDQAHPNTSQSQNLMPLSYNSVHSITQKPSSDSESVSLLEALAAKLQRDPSLLGFFIDDVNFEEGNLLVFQGLLKHLWDPGAVGERARKGMCLCLQLPIASSAPLTTQPTSIPEQQQLNDNPGADKSLGVTDGSPSSTVPKEQAMHLPMIDYEKLGQRLVITKHIHMYIIRFYHFHIHTRFSS